jgi:hypothetical protein
MNNTTNLDQIIRKVNGHTSLVAGEEVLVTIDPTSGRAIEKTLLVRVAGNYQDYLVANDKNATRNAGGELPTYYVRDAHGKRALAIEISFTVSCPAGCEIKVAEALQGAQTPGGILVGLLQRWVREFIPLGDESKFIDSYDAARRQLEKHIAARAHSQTGLALKPIVTLSGRPAREIIVGPIEIGVRLHRYTEEQKLTVEAGLELDPQNFVKASVYQEAQDSAEELFKQQLKEFFFQQVTVDQFTRDLQYPSFKQPLLHFLSTALKQVGRRVRFINLSTSLSKNVVPPRELVKVTYDYQHSIHGRSLPVLVQNTVQLYCEDSESFRASGVGDLEAWVKETLDVVLKRYLIGQTYVGLLLRFYQVEQDIKREMSTRAAALGYRVDHLVSLPNLKERELKNPFLIAVEDNFETRLEGLEVQLKFDVKLRIPQLESIEKYLNPGTDVKEAIKEMILTEARQTLRDIQPERFYLYFNHPNKAASSASEDDRLPVKDLLDKRIRESIKREFEAEILSLTPRVGRTDLTDRHKNLCHVIRAFRVSIDSPDPQATEALVLSGNFEFRGVYPDSAGWQRFSVLRLDLDDLQSQLETHLRAELKTFYQSGFMFQNRIGRDQVFSLVKDYAGLYMRQEFGLIIHLTNLDRNTTLAEQHRRQLLIDLENNKLAALVDQSEHLVSNLKELRRKRVNLLSVSPVDKQTLEEIDENIRSLEAELESISSARFGQHRLAAALETQVPDAFPLARREGQMATLSEAEETPKGRLTG